MAAGNATSTVYVGNLPADSTPDAIRAAFNSFGTITGIECPEMRPRARPRPVFCWVTFSSPAAAAAAVDGANGQQFGDRTMRVELQLGEDARAERRDARAAERAERRAAERAERRAAAPAADGEGGRRRRRRGSRRQPPLMTAAPTNVFIGRLDAADTTEEGARSLCSPFGTVEEVVVARNNRFMFVRFASAAEAQACIAGLDGKEVNGRTAVVQAVTREEREAPAAAPAGARPRRQRRRRTDPASVFVGNISRDVERADINQLFGEENIAGMNLRGRFAVVRFVDEERAAAALAFNGADIKGNTIRVEKMGQGASE